MSSAAAIEFVVNVGQARRTRACGGLGGRDVMCEHLMVSGRLAAVTRGRFAVLCCDLAVGSGERGVR